MHILLKNLLKRILVIPLGYTLKESQRRTCETIQTLGGSRGTGWFSVVLRFVWLVWHHYAAWRVYQWLVDCVYGVCWNNVYTLKMRGGKEMMPIYFSLVLMYACTVIYCHLCLQVNTNTNDQSLFRLATKQCSYFLGSCDIHFRTPKLKCKRHVVPFESSLTAVTTKTN